MRTPPLLLTALVAGTGCEPWPSTSGALYLLDSTWAPEAAVATDDGLFVPLPHHGGLARIAGDGTHEIVDLGDDRIDRLSLTHSGTLLARTVQVSCPDQPDLEEIRRCADPRTEGGLIPLEDGTPGARQALGTWFEDLTFSDDGRFAVSTVRPDATTSGGGLVNLNAMWVYDLDSGDQWEIAVGFAADRILFTTDETGTTDGAVVLSESEVALVDLSTPTFSPDVVFPLTLDPSSPVDPTDVALTPDGRYALITVSGLTDLYVIDLVQRTFNLIALSGRPTDLLVLEDRDETLIAYSNALVVDVLSHDDFSLAPLSLDNYADTLTAGDGLVMASRSGTEDLFRIDLDDLDVAPYRLNFPTQSLYMAPSGDLAVSLFDNGTSSRLELVDLARDAEGDLDDDPKSFGLDQPGVGVAFAASADDPEATTLLILQEDEDALFELTWPTLQTAVVELDEAPRSIGTFDEDTFYITHDRPMGLITLYTPGEDPVTAANFATDRLLDKPALATDGTEE